jgi:hypothetical protein
MNVMSVTFTLLKTKKKRLITVPVVLLSLVALLISSFQIYGISRDFFNYDFFFELVRSSRWGALEDSRFEKGFVVTSILLTSYVASNLDVYSIFVVIVMFIKSMVFQLISKSTYIFCTVALFYMFRYFPLHELTQVRIACASSFLLIAAVFFWNGRWCYGLLGCTLALLFHTSIFAVIPVLFIKTTSRFSIILISFCVFICVLLSARVMQNYLANYVEAIAMYQDKGFGDDIPNPLSAALLIDWYMISCSLVILWDKCSLLMKRIILLEVIGMAIYYGLFEYPVFAHRLRELYTVFWIFFVAEGLRYKSTEIPVIAFVVLSIGWHSYIIFTRGFFE